MIDASITVRREDSREAKSSWPLHLGFLGFLLLLLGVLFADDILAAVRVWWEYPAYSHCFLIVPISGWLIWSKRQQLALERPALAPKALLLILLLEGVWLVGKYTAITELRQFAIVGMVQAVALLFLGARIYRLILFPALFLFFSVPTGQYLIPMLQRFTTKFVDIGLTLINIPHYTEGTIIELTNGRFEIAEACAGLRFLIATLALGTLFAHLSFRKWTKIVLFLGACIVVPVIANGFRALGIVVLAHATNNKLATGADHIIYGWGFFVVIMLAMLFVGTRMSDPITAAVPRVPPCGSRASSASFVAVAVCAVLATMMGPAFAWWRDSQPVQYNTFALTRPLQIRGWAISHPTGTWRPAYASPDAQLLLSLTQQSQVPGTAVDLAVEYYGHLRDGHKLIAATNSLWDRRLWQAVGSRAMTARLDGVPISIAETTISSGQQRRMLWSWYWVDGRFASAPLTVMLLELNAEITGKRAAAVIAMSTPIDATAGEARQRLRRALGALQSLPRRLADAGHKP